MTHVQHNYLGRGPATRVGVRAEGVHGVLVRGGGRARAGTARQCASDPRSQGVGRGAAGGSQSLPERDGSQSQKTVPTLELRPLISDPSRVGESRGPGGVRAKLWGTLLFVGRQCLPSHYLLPANLSNDWQGAFS